MFSICIQNFQIPSVCLILLLIYAAGVPRGKEKLTLELLNGAGAGRGPA